MTRRTVAAFVGAVVMLVGTADVAAAKALSLKQLKDILSDLGYEPTDQADNRISLDDQGRFKRDIQFALNDDMTVLNIYTPLTDIADDKKAAVPASDLLKANDSTGPFAYAIVTNDGKERLDIEGYFDTATVNKQMLRRTIDALVSAQDEGEPLWNDDHWATPTAQNNPPRTSDKTLDEAKAEFDAAWEKSPLTIRHGMFVAEKPQEYGGYVKRPDSTFKAGETLVSYTEPEGYVWKPLDGDLQAIDLTMDMLLSDKDGAVLADQKGFASKSFRTHGKATSLFMTMDLNVNGLPPGDYQIRYTLHDANSAKTAELTLPFKAVP